MKRQFAYFLFAVTAVFFASCKHNEPRINVGANPVILMKGDCAAISISDANEVYYEYSKSRNESNPVFEISDFKGFTTVVRALNVGTDTLYVNMNWNVGMHDYGLPVSVTIKVIDKE